MKDQIQIDDLLSLRALLKKVQKQRAFSPIRFIAGETTADSGVALMSINLAEALCLLVSALADSGVAMEAYIERESALLMDHGEAEKILGAFVDFLKSLGIESVEYPQHQEPE